MKTLATAIKKVSTLQAPELTDKQFYRLVSVGISIAVTAAVLLAVFPGLEKYLIN